MFDYQRVNEQFCAAMVHTNLPTLLGKLWQVKGLLGFIGCQTNIGSLGNMACLGKDFTV
jgi:hypothetical protein